jgi:hypothetical protein
MFLLTCWLYKHTKLTSRGGYRTSTLYIWFSKHLQKNHRQHLRLREAHHTNRQHLWYGEYHHTTQHFGCHHSWQRQRTMQL